MAPHLNYKGDFRGGHNPNDNRITRAEIANELINTETKLKFTLQQYASTLNKLSSLVYGLLEYLEVPQGELAAAITRAVAKIKEEIETNKKVAEAAEKIAAEAAEAKSKESVDSPESPREITVVAANGDVSGKS